MMSQRNLLTAMILVVAMAAAASPQATATPPPREGKFCSSPHPAWVTPDPADCSRFFRCLDRKYHAMQCGEGLLFNLLLRYCDKAEAVECETSEFDGCCPGRAMDIGGIEDGFSSFITYPRPSHGLMVIIYDISFSAIIFRT